MQKRTWLAGASLLALVLGAGDANAVLFGFPGGGEYITPSTGYYDFEVAGAASGKAFDAPSFPGALVGGELFLVAGDILEIIVGGAGGDGGGGNGYGAGGGGGSFVFGAGLLFAAAGAGGGPGIGSGGHPGGYGGAGGFGVANFPGQTPAQPGSFPFGGAGACCYFGGGPPGGYGGGGGGGYSGNGGGGGAAGVRGYGGGYSYVIGTARNAFGITGGNTSVGPPWNDGDANGYVSINFVAAPEPSTWAMTIAGFIGLGWLAHLRKRKLTPT
jgi:hypothetical protein